MTGGSAATAQRHWAGYGALTRVETLMFLREPFAVLFTIALPVGLHLIFAASFGRYDELGIPLSSLGLTGITLMVASYLGLMGVPIVIAEYREMGVIRSLRVTPLRLRTFVAAHVTVEVGMCALSLALCYTVTALGFGLEFRGSVVALLVLTTALLLTFLALGFAISSLGFSARTSQALGASMYFLSLFTSGATIPRSQFPSGLRAVFDRMPASVLLDQLRDTWAGQQTWSGFVVAITVLAVVAAGAVVVAVRGFVATAGRAG